MKVADLLNVPTPSVQSLATKYDVTVEKVEQALAKGVKVELEHTTKPHVAREIALDHLAERLDYYDLLAGMDEATTRTSKAGAPGTLKAKISGPVTCDKVKALKNRSHATPHDVRQANWFINMHGCSESQNLTEIFQEPAQHLVWKRGEHGSYHFFETEFSFMGRRVVVGLYEDHDQVGARFVSRNTDVDLPSDYKGYSVVFSVNGSTDATGEIGAAASKLFARVVSVLRGFLSTHAWDYVLFIGESGSRDKLYDAIAHLLANQVGAQVATYRSDFLIYKPFPLHEVFDYKLSSDDWEVEQRPDGLDIEFKVGHVPYLLEITEFKKTPGIFEAIFSHAGMAPWDDATGILNTGNAFQVFSAVAQLLEHSIKVMRIKAIYFTAAEPSRVKLYRSLTKYFAAKLNWKVTQDPQWMPVSSTEAQFLVYKPGFSLTEQGGVGLVVPGVNMPAGMHKDEIRRQAIKFGNRVSATGVPPITDPSGKLPR